MKKIFNSIIIILIIIATCITAIISYRYYKNSKNEARLKKIIAQTKQDVKKSKDEENMPYIEYEGYQVIGIIKIEKINIEYPILNVSNEDSMRKSITKFWGDGVNTIGNLTLAGHNNMDGTMFGKTKKLEIGDEIQIFDLYNQVVTYKIFEKYITDPNDVECTRSIEANTKELTLITCTNGNRQRLIIKAREK